MGLEGTVTPATKEEIDRQIAALEKSGANPDKFQRLKDHRATMSEASAPQKSPAKPRSQKG